MLQPGAPELCNEKPPLSADGDPGAYRTKGIETGLPLCALFYLVQDGPKYELPKPRPGQRNGRNRKFAGRGDPTRLPRRLLLFSFGRAQ